MSTDIFFKSTVHVSLGYLVAFRLMRTPCGGTKGVVLHFLVI